MKKTILIALVMLVNSTVFSQLTSKGSTALIDQDTLITIKKSDLVILNKVISSESFYRSMYGNSSEKVKNLEMQNELMIKNFESLNETIKLLEDKNDQLIIDKIGMEMMFETAHGMHLYEENVKRLWKTTTIIGIPVSVGLGIVIANKFIK